LKIDDIVEKIYKSTNPKEQKEVHSQAKVVLDLLRDKKEMNLEASHLAELVEK
jgi:hypothetical protein